MTHENPYVAKASLDLKEPPARRKRQSFSRRFLPAWFFTGISGSIFGAIFGPAGLIAGFVWAMVVGLVITPCVFGVASAALGRRGLYRNQILVNGISGGMTGAVAFGFVALPFPGRTADIVFLMTIAICMGAGGAAIAATLRPVD